MSNKRLFQILDEMNVEDIKNDTKMVSVSGSLISVNLTKRGTVVTMGAGPEVSQELLREDKMAFLVVIDMDEYKKKKTL